MLGGWSEFDIDIDIDIAPSFQSMPVIHHNHTLDFHPCYILHALQSRKVVTTEP